MVDLLEMDVANWEDEMNRMLSGFEHQAMASLKVMKEAFKSSSTFRDPTFEKHFFTLSINR